MKITVKKLKRLIELVRLEGTDPTGKPTTLCDEFYVDVATDVTGKMSEAKVNAKDRNNAFFIFVNMETELVPACRIPITVDDMLGKSAKLGRFNDTDIINVKTEGNAVILHRAKPSKKFTINNPVKPIETYFDPSMFTFAPVPNGVSINGNVFDTHIKTTAEAMLDVIEDAKPFYKSVTSITFPLTITNDSVRIDIGDKTIGSVESELQVTVISTPVQKKVTFGLGLHNIFKNLEGAVDLYFGNIKGATKENPAVLVEWQANTFKAKYLLKGF